MPHKGAYIANHLLLAVNHPRGLFICKYGLFWLYFYRGVLSGLTYAYTITY